MDLAGLSGNFRHLDTQPASSHAAMPVANAVAARPLSTLTGLCRYQARISAFPGLLPQAVCPLTAPTLPVRNAPHFGR